MSTDRPVAAPWILPTLLGGLLGLLAMVGFGTAVTVLTLGLQLLFLAFFVRHLAFVVIAIRAAPAGGAPRPGSATPRR